MKFSVKEKRAVIPRKATRGSAGWDIFSLQDGWLFWNICTVFRTGVNISFEKSKVYGLLKSRSGLCAKHSISVEGGVIDTDYTGEIKVILKKSTPLPYKVRRGDRIAQLCLVPLMCDKEEDRTPILNSDRGSGGFGSTGR